MFITAVNAWLLHAPARFPHVCRNVLAHFSSPKMCIFALRSLFCVSLSWILRAAFEGSMLSSLLGICHSRPPPVQLPSDRRWGVSACDSDGDTELRQVGHKQPQWHRKTRHEALKLKSDTTCCCLMSSSKNNQL